MRLVAKLIMVGAVFAIAIAIVIAGGEWTVKTNGSQRVTAVASTLKTAATTSTTIGGQEMLPPAPQPCPAGLTEPSMQTGSFCGPEPTGGDGKAAQGVCDGTEKAPPCGSGVVVGRYYSFSLPVSCSGITKSDVPELPNTTFA